MKIDRARCPFPLSKALIDILEREIARAAIQDSQAVTITFRDQDYSPETGGFHPVEIRIGSGGGIEYITDFSYVGLPPFSELTKEIDFDFSLGLLQHHGQEFPIQQGSALFQLWQRNFCAYSEMGVYSVEVTPD